MSGSKGLQRYNGVEQDDEGAYVHYDEHIAALRRAKAEVWREAEKLGMEQSPHHTACALKWARECVARAAQIEEGE